MTTIRRLSPFLLVSSLAAAAPPAWDRASLERHRDDLFDHYPATRCALTLVLGKEHEQIVEAEYAGGSAGMDERALGPTDTAGGVIAVRALFQSATKRLLWVHPDGRLIVGLAEEGEPLRLITTDPSLAENPPEAVQMFITLTASDPEETPDEAAPAKAAASAWDVRKTDVSSCQGPAIEAAVVEMNEIAAGDRCSARVADYGLFSPIPHVVVPEADSPRVALSAAPRPAPPGEKVSYLVAGDLVQVLTSGEGISERNGFVCAWYRSKTGSTSVGWAPRAVIRALPEGNDAVMALLGSLQAPKGWFPKAEHRLSYPGKDRQDQVYVLKARFAPKGAGLALELVSNYSGEPGTQDEEGGCRDKVALSLSAPRVAVGKHDAFNVTAYRFNNAIWLVAPDFCDDAGTGGFFYPTP